MGDMNFRNNSSEYKYINHNLFKPHGQNNPINRTDLSSKEIDKKIEDMLKCYICEFPIIEKDNQKTNIDNNNIIINKEKINNENNNKSIILENDKDICVKHKNKTEYYCINCDKYLCSDCLAFFGEDLKKHPNHLILQKSKMNDPFIKIVIDEYKRIIEIKNQDFQNLSKENELLKNELNELKEKNKNLHESLLEKDNEIKELKTKIQNYGFELKEGEKLVNITLMSTDESIIYSLMCKSSDRFIDIEKILYKKFPELLNSENKFFLKGIEIKKYKSLDENIIKNGDIITFNNMINS